MEKKPVLQLRQGDVFLEEVAELPGGAINVKSTDGRHILAWGEATGHAHVVADPGVELYEVAGERFLVVREPATLRHEEHNLLALPLATFRITLQREYDPAERRRARLVLD